MAAGRWQSMGVGGWWLCCNHPGKVAGMNVCWELEVNYPVLLVTHAVLCPVPQHYPGHNELGESQWGVVSPCGRTSVGRGGLGKWRRVS